MLEIESCRLRILVAADKHSVESADLCGGCLIEIRSTPGIGRATLQRTADRWPEPIAIRLHLRGLESFQIHCEHQILEWSFPSTADGQARQVLRDQAGEHELTSEHPLRSPLVVKGGEPKIPLVDGYFEVVVPSALLVDFKPSEIRIAWIDFYR